MFTVNPAYNHSISILGWKGPFIFYQAARGVGGGGGWWDLTDSSCSILVVNLYLTRVIPSEYLKAYLLSIGALN